MAAELVGKLKGNNRRDARAALTYLERLIAKDNAYLLKTNGAPNIWLLDEATKAAVNAAANSLTIRLAISKVVPIQQ